MNVRSDRDAGRTAAPPDLPSSPSEPTRDERVIDNQGLVHRIARGFGGRGLDHAELVQCGSIGLIRAAEKFDPARGFRFSTYATFWIRQAIHKGLGDAHWPIRVPQHARKEGSKVLAAAKVIRAETGHGPRLEDVAAGMGVPPKRREVCVRAAAAMAYRPSPGAVEELALSSEAAAPADLAIDAEEREQLGRALLRLDERARRVLAIRYGLDGGPGATLDAAAAALGITRRMVRWDEARGVATLRRLLVRAG